jgi:hypothetical protein
MITSDHISFANVLIFNQKWREKVDAIGKRQGRDSGEVTGGNTAIAVLDFAIR